MAKILLIETATEVCSAAIAKDGNVLALAEDLQQRNHAAQLTLLIQQCTREAGISLAALDAVAVSSGPGSYTSLRVGASVAKGICYALDKPLIAVDTLKALAAASFETHFRPGNELKTETPVFAIPMLDARRNEVWAAVYDVELRLLAPAQPLILENKLLYEFLSQNPVHKPGCVYIVAGNGAKKMKSAEIFENAVWAKTQHSSATYLATLAEKAFKSSDFQDVSYFNPAYMKAANITSSNKPLF